jgi:predicted transcriptional regulator
MKGVGKMDIKLFNSELKVMEVLWREGELPAKRVADILAEEIGWNQNTTYTVIKKCIAKNAISRHEPKFVCRPEITREEVQQAETDELIDKMYGGSADKLVAALLGSRKLSENEISELKRIVEELK